MQPVIVLAKKLQQKFEHANVPRMLVAQLRTNTDFDFQAPPGLHMTALQPQNPSLLRSDAEKKSWMPPPKGLKTNAYMNTRNPQVAGNAGGGHWRQRTPCQTPYLIRGTCGFEFNTYKVRRGPKDIATDTLPNMPHVNAHQVSSGCTAFVGKRFCCLTCLRIPLQQYLCQ